MKTCIKKGKVSVDDTTPEEILNPSTFKNTIKKTALLKKINSDIKTLTQKEPETKTVIVPEKKEIIDTKESITKELQKLIIDTDKTTYHNTELKQISVDKSYSKETKIQDYNLNGKINKKLNTGYSKKLKPVLRKIQRDPELTFEKHIENPIICPKPENGWESWQTFNPAAILINNNVHFLYRAIGGDGMSRFGYAMSQDGFTIRERLSFPAYEHEIVKEPHPFFSCASGGSWGGCEDPRLVRVDNEDRIYVTYTACDGGLRVGLTSIKINDFINKRWKWKKPKIISPPNEVNKNWLIFPEKINGKYAILHSINSGKILIDYFDNLNFKDGTYINSKYLLTEVRADRWDKKVRAAGPPPIRTKYGWLLFYHAEDKDDPGKYKVGAMILDINDPKKILYRCKQPVLEPKEYYECEGYKGGIVYALGSVIKDNKLIIYYGGADNFVCVAYTEFEPFLEALIRGEKKPLKFKTLKKK